MWNVCHSFVWNGEKCIKLTDTVANLKYDHKESIEKD